MGKPKKYTRRTTGRSIYSKRDPHEKNKARAVSKKVIDNIMSDYRKKTEPKAPKTLGPRMMIIEYMKRQNFITFDYELIDYMKKERPTLDKEYIQNLIFNIKNDIALISNCIKEKGYTASTEEIKEFIDKKKIIQGWPNDELEETIESIKKRYTIISNIMRNATSNEEIIKKASKVMPKMHEDEIQKIINQIEKDNKSFKETIMVDCKELTDMIDRLKESYFSALSDKSKSLESINASFLANNQEMYSYADKFGTSVFRILEEWKQLYVKKFINENQLLILEMNIEINRLFNEGIIDSKRILQVLKHCFSDKIPLSVAGDLFKDVLKGYNESFYKKNKTDKDGIEL